MCLRHGRQQQDQQAARPAPEVEVASRNLLGIAADLAGQPVGEHRQQAQHASHDGIRGEGHARHPQDRNIVGNFCRIHGSLRITPAMAAGVTDRVWELIDLIGG